MELFLQIIGGVLITIALLIVAIYLFFKFKFGQFLSLDGGQMQTPLIIHLNENFYPIWMDNKKVKLVDEELVRLGFERGKSYSIPEMEELDVTAYFKAPLVATLCKHKIAGIWVDFILEKPGELELTVTNVPMGEAVDLRPEKKIEYFKEKTATQLYEHINSHIEDGIEYKVIGSDDFREVFEQDYKKDMTYRARNGGISFEEFLQHKKELGKKLSAKDTREAFLMFKEQELEQWHEVAIEEYTSTLSDKERENIYEDSNLLVVPFRTDAEAFIRYLDMEGYIDDEDENIGKKFKDETGIFKLFARLNEGRSPGLRATLVGETSYPLQLKIFKYKY